VATVTAKLAEMGIQPAKKIKVLDTGVLAGATANPLIPGGCPCMQL
jgi:Fe2+ transport system protein FeoA